MKIEIDEKTFTELGKIWLAVLGPIALCVFAGLANAIFQAIMLLFK